MNTILKGTTTHEVELEDRDGRLYTGRITGVEIAESRDDTVYVTDDQPVIVYNRFRLSYEVVDDPENDLRGLEPGAYTQAMDALGIKTVIDL